jgi:hypothetical protein
VDSRTRKAIFDRDKGVARIRNITWRIGWASVAGVLLTAAGFSHVLPTHLPHVNLNSSSNSSGSGRNGDGGNGGSGNNGGLSNSSNSGGLQGPGMVPGQGSRPSHVSSGGS